MNKIAFALIAVSVLLLGCTATVSIAKLNENPQDFVGKEIAVAGTVENTLKIGSLSGYKLAQGGESILVSSKSLPEEGKQVTVSGTWTKDSLFGYYLLAK